MVNIDIEAFKKAGYSFEEIQQVIKSEENFERTGVVHSFDDVKRDVRAKLFTNIKVNV